MSPEAIARCEKIIRPHIRRTPVICVDAGDFGLGANTIACKLELLQHAGSFKARGAFANLLTRAVPLAGVVAASGGNHGAAVAYAAMRLEVPARIFVPSVSSPAKIKRIRDCGADLVIEGDRYDDALTASEIWAAQSGAMPVHAFDQDETMLGQGTLGLELEQQAHDIDTLLVAVGGGGLIAGIAAWYAGRIKLVGVEPVASPTLTRALGGGAAGRCGSRRRGVGFAGAAAGRRAGLSDRQRARSWRRAGDRRRHRGGAAGALAGRANRGGAGRRSGLRGAPVGRLSTAARRTRRRRHQRRQYHGGRFRRRNQSTGVRSCGGTIFALRS